ncbi:hypothetical protein BCU70_08070 [Vibrio sp. 10N.286.49.C2]|uniref:TatD family hydrolase n=1 Tax=unclassified Vibrio TaxID=2614977 RepID=UPI000C815C4D|nr:MULTISPECIES: TatD family hydrolase [unclassified Vibrio]PMH29590.1 hypothetical protein BCU70_08070 [Vibrio sp. 10N.286.49.C2]PMH56105.1 hypothetical protein BCU66_07980 [Vibrio sp. 10N.286.49.B1]PMH81068.1 hypothetical protein BCU58_03125 [Vibrio sp. 10N.286.48.B7]
MMIDTHCHLDLVAKHTDLPAVISEARLAGVKAMIVPGIDENNWSTVTHLAQQYDDVYYALGYHPAFLDTLAEHSIAKLDAQVTAALEGSNKCVAIGECGLDFYTIVGMESVEALKSQQKQLLKEHIFIANAHQLPVILHCRKAHQDMVALLRQCPPKHGGVIHGFSGSYQQAMDYVNLGISIGVGGVISYERAKKTRETISRLPIECLLIETDAPDMPLSGYQGRINKPKMIKLTLSTLIMLRSESAQTVTSQVLINSKSLFSICD